MTVPYTRFLSFLVNGLDKSYKCNLFHINDDLEFTFKEYVFSQMHLAIICHLLKRDLYVIYRVYRCIDEGREVSKSDLLLVLRWYYRDMAGFFMNLARTDRLQGVSLRVCAPADLFSSYGVESELVSFYKEKSEVMHALHYGEGKYEKFTKLFYREIQKLDSLYETDEQKNRYAMAMILSYFSEYGKFIEWSDIVD